ncbi:hypothetical protein ACO02O_08444 [Dirofilaria immitis]
MMCFSSLSYVKKKDAKIIYHFSIAIHLTAAGSYSVMASILLSLIDIRSNYKFEFELKCAAFLRSSFFKN